MTKADTDLTLTREDILFGIFHALVGVLKRTYPQVLSFFKGRGGLRASIVQGGTICVGDTLSLAPIG